MLKSTHSFIITLVFVLVATGQIAVPQTAKDYFDTGLRFLREKKFSEALDAFRSSARLDPLQPATHANIGATLIVLRRPGDAIAAFREAIKLRPNEGSFHTALCNVLSLTQKHKEAVVACREGVRLNPDSPDAHAALINAMRLGKALQTEIQQLLDLVLSRFRDNELILTQAAAYYAGTGNFSYAAELFERLVRMDPNSALYHARLADVYLSLERDADALAAARRSLALEPANPFAHYFMGKLFFELGQHEEAANAFEKVISSGDDLPDARYYFALSEARRGRFASAVSALRTAVANDPDNFKYQLELGSLLNRDAKYEEAVDPLRIAVRLDPKDVEAKAALGLALFESARFSEAIPILEEANRLQPANSVVTMFLNVARTRQQQIPRIEDMKRMANENPDDIKIRVALVQLLAFARRIEEAEPFVKEILKLKPKDVQVFHIVAVAYSTAGELDKALAVYRKSLEIAESPAAYLGFAGIFAKRGQAEEASKAYAKVIELKPDTPNIMKVYADHLRDHGKRREALEMYKRSLALLPMNGPALFNAGILSAKLGDTNGARQYLETLRTADPALAKILDRCLRLMIWQ